MRKLKKKLTAAGPPLVVATAHTKAGLSEASKLPMLRPDPLVVEARLDCLLAARADIGAALSQMGAPALLTARHPAEGGAGKLSARVREALLLEHLPFASAVDVELRSAGTLRAVMEGARARGVLLVVSSHNFRLTPTLNSLRKTVEASWRAGADVVKVATFLRGPRDLAALVRLQASSTRPLATMGMGPLGKASRLALAAVGSRLNYGYLDRAQVAGQWPAVLLRGLLASIVPAAKR